MCKKIITLALFAFLNFSLFSQTLQTVTYTASTDNILNPERGFLRHLSARSTGYNLLTSSQLSSYKTNGNSIVLRLFYLHNFISQPISSSYLSNMQSDFNTLRNAGMKCVVRFAYSDSDNSGILYNPSKSKILQDIAQIAPILQSNQDVIMSCELGWIGAWGEGDTTDCALTTEFGNTQGSYLNWNATKWNNRKEVYEAFMNVLPNKYFHIRMPSSKMALYGTTPIAELGSDYKHRLGGHNDCFLGSANDYWTYIPTPPAPEYPYLQQETKFVPMGGETCALNPPRSNYTTADQEMRGFHYSYLNEDYNVDVLASWGTSITDVKKLLGYRLELINSVVPSLALVNTDFNITLNLRNIGYAAPFNQRNVYLVFRNTITNIEYKYFVSTDIRTWLGNVTINKTITNVLPIGVYKVFLSMPDINPTISSRSDYAIRCANLNTWESSSGYNDLLQTISIQSSLNTNPPVVNPLDSAVVTNPILNGIFYITLAQLRNYTVELYDMNGRVMRTRITYGTPNKVVCYNLKRGSYVLKIYNSTYSKSFNLIY